MRTVDELAGVKPGPEVRWQIVTKAKIQINGSRARLTEDGRTLDVNVKSPVGAVLSIAPAEGSEEFDEPIPGFQRLRVAVRAPASGEVQIKVEVSSSVGPVEAGRQ